jgi:hypothetical protein
MTNLVFKDQLPAILNANGRIGAAGEADIELSSSCNCALPKVLEIVYHVFDLELVALVEGIDKAD